MTAIPARQPHQQRCEHYDACWFVHIHHRCPNDEPTEAEKQLKDCQLDSRATHTSPPAPVPDALAVNNQSYSYGYIAGKSDAAKAARDSGYEDGFLKGLQQGKGEGAKAAREKAIEQLSDLNKYSCEEYEEANLSDNEREMRIHLEYGNRTWDIIRSLRAQQAGEP